MNFHSPDHVAGFRCLACGNEMPFAFPAYRCTCGGNLEVRYETDRVRARFSPPAAADLLRRGHFAYDALLPLAGDGQRHFHLTVGNSPLVSRPDMAAEAGIANLYFKDDSRLPSASFKDRASSVLIALAAERGITRICTASTGNAGCSMACLSADAGLDAYVFVPRTAPRAKIAQLLFYGARVVQVDGTYDDAFDMCWEIAERYGWLNRSTGWNPFTREGKKTVSFEVAQQLDWKVPDLVFVPVGDGNIISGTWKGFADLHAIGAIDRVPRIVAVQATGSNAIALALERIAAGTPVAEAIQPVRATTTADSISVDLPRDALGAVRAVTETGGFAIQVTDDEIQRAIVTLSRRAGIFSEPASAAAYAGFLKWAESATDAGDLNVVCLVTGNGLKDVEAAVHLAGEPLIVPPDVAAAARELGL